MQWGISYDYARPYWARVYSGNTRMNLRRIDGCARKLAFPYGYAWPPSLMLSRQLLLLSRAPVSNVYASMFARPFHHSYICLSARERYSRARRGLKRMYSVMVDDKLLPRAIGVVVWYVVDRGFRNRVVNPKGYGD